MIANKKFWDGLPVGIRAQLEKAMADATAYANDTAQTDNDEAMVEMKKSGRTTVIELTPEQKTAWRKALEPVYTEMASRIGQDVIDEFQREAQVATK